MGIVQVIIDRTTSMIIEGTYEFDRTDGGTLVAPSGSAFPSAPAAKEWFWRSDESKLYRRNDTNTAWDAVVSAIAAHRTTHEPGGTDALTVDAAAATGSLRTVGTGALQACAGNDARLSDARTPVAHKASHEPGGSDALTVDAAAITGSFRTIGTGALQACAGNDGRLSDARTPTAHKTSHEPGGTDALTVDAAAATGSLRTLGTGALQACAGNDSRLSNARTPTSHATTHQNGGSDEVATATAAANAIPKAGAASKLDIAWLPTGATGTTVCIGNDSRLSDARTPTSHASTHNAGGGDALAIDAAAGTGSLRTLGTSATSACAGNDSRLSDARTPTAHAASHHTGGADLLAHQSIPGSGTNTHSQIDTHLGSTSNPHSVTKTQVGLGNVTDDAQLKRAAADFAVFTSKATPVSADVLLIEDSADSNNKKKITVGSLPSSVFGANYQTAISTARSTTTSATMQDKTTLTTGALTGTYRVGWCSVIDAATANKEVQAQLYNVTDAVVIGAVQDQRPVTAAPKMYAGGFAEVVFTGAAKTFKIQFRSPDGSTTVGIQDARIELWRVS